MSSFLHRPKRAKVSDPDNQKGKFLKEILSQKHVVDGSGYYMIFACPASSPSCITRFSFPEEGNGVTKILRQEIQFPGELISSMDNFCDFVLRGVENSGATSQIRGQLKDHLIEAYPNSGPGMAIEGGYKDKPTPDTNRPDDGFFVPEDIQNWIEARNQAVADGQNVPDALPNGKGLSCTQFTNIPDLKNLGRGGWATVREWRFDQSVERQFYKFNGNGDLVVKINGPVAFPAQATHDRGMHAILQFPMFFNLILKKSSEGPSSTGFDAAVSPEARNLAAMF